MSEMESQSDRDTKEEKDKGKSDREKETPEVKLEKQSRLARKTIEEKHKIKIDEIEDVLETEPEKKSRGIMLAQFFIPWIIALLVIACLYIFLPEGKFLTLGFWMLVYFFPPFGKESVIPLAIAGDRLEGAVPFEYPEMFVPMEPWLIALAVAFLDIIAGLFLVWNFDFIKKIPLMGKWIKKIESKGGTILKENRYIEALSFIGVVLFVMFPFQGSGGVGASIVGRAIGMNPYKVLGAIIIGALAGCFLIAYAADSFFRVFMENRLLGLLFLAVVVALVAVLLLRKRIIKNKTEESVEDNGGDDNGT